MGFDVFDFVLIGTGHTRQSGNLVLHTGIQLCITHLHGTAAKALQVWIAGVRTDTDAVLFSALYSFEHDKWIACMKSASKIGAINDRQHRIVRAHHPRAKALAHVCVEIDFFLHHSSLSNLLTSFIATQNAANQVVRQQCFAVKIT